MAKQERALVKADLCIKDLKKKIIFARTSLGSHVPKEASTQPPKPLGAAEASDATRKILQSRLEIYVRRVSQKTEDLNFLSASNELIKSEINELRTEAVRFNRNLTELKTKFKTVKKVRSTLDKQIEGWYKERDIAQEMMCILDIERETALKKFKSSWEQIQKIVGESNTNFSESIAQKEKQTKLQKQKQMDKKKRVKEQMNKKFKRNIIGYTEKEKLKQFQESEKIILNMTSSLSLEDLLKKVLDLEDAVSTNVIKSIRDSQPNPHFFFMLQLYAMGPKLQFLEDDVQEIEEEIATIRNELQFTGGMLNTEFATGSKSHKQRVFQSLGKENEELEVTIRALNSKLENYNLEMQSFNEPLQVCAPCLTASLI